MFNFFKNLFKKEQTTVEAKNEPKTEAPYKIEPPILNVYVSDGSTKAQEPVLSKTSSSEVKTLGEYLSDMHTEPSVTKPEKKPAKKKVTKAKPVAKKPTEEAPKKPTAKPKKTKSKM